MPVVEYPIVALLGDRGDGKTLSLTTLAKVYSKAGANVYANFDLYDIEYTHIDFTDLIDYPEYLHDGVILLDEAHIGADAYAAFESSVQSITRFATQTRKRRLTIFYSTQVLTQTVKRLRQLTNYIYECQGSDINGVIIIDVYEKYEYRYVKTIVLDGRNSFDNYDTNEIIEKN